MCYKQPGLRCSPHAGEGYRKANGQYRLKFPKGPRVAVLDAAEANSADPNWTSPTLQPVARDANSAALTVAQPRPLPVAVEIVEATIEPDAPQVRDELPEIIIEVIPDTPARGSLRRPEPKQIAGHQQESSAATARRWHRASAGLDLVDLEGDLRDEPAKAMPIGKKNNDAPQWVRDLVNPRRGFYRSLLSIITGR